MRLLARGVLNVLVLAALFWTIYEEWRHLGGYFAGAGKTLGLGEYFDVAATVMLIGYAGYELLAFAGVTRPLREHLRARPELEVLVLCLIAALCWGIYRDIVHFRHQYGGTGAGSRVFDDIDTAAAVILSLGVLKVAYHALGAIQALWGLARERRRLAARNAGM